MLLLDFTCHHKDSKGLLGFMKADRGLRLVSFVHPWAPRYVVMETFPSPPAPFDGSFPVSTLSFEGLMESLVVAWGDVGITIDDTSSTSISLWKFLVPCLTMLPYLWLQKLIWSMSGCYFSEAFGTLF